MPQYLKINKYTKLERHNHAYAKFIEHIKCLIVHKKDWRLHKFMYIELIFLNLYFMNLWIPILIIEDMSIL